MTIKLLAAIGLRSIATALTDLAERLAPVRREFTLGNAKVSGDAMRIITDALQANGYILTDDGDGVARFTKSEAARAATADAISKAGR